MPPSQTTTQTDRRQTVCHRTIRTDRVIMSYVHSARYTSFILMFNGIKLFFYNCYSITSHCEHDWSHTGVSHVNMTVPPLMLDVFPCGGKQKQACHKKNNYFLILCPVTFETPWVKYHQVTAFELGSGWDTLVVGGEWSQSWWEGWRSPDRLRVL